MKETLSDRLISIWAIQDALLQAYRNIYLFFTAILLAFGWGLLYFLLSSNMALPKLILTGLGVFGIGILGIYIIKQWKQVTEKRGNDVSFLQKQLIYLENKEQIGVLCHNSCTLDFISIKDTNEFSVVTTFKNFENSTSEIQNKILLQFEISAFISNGTIIDTSTRETFNKWLPLYCYLVWIIYGLLFFYDIYFRLNLSC